MDETSVINALVFFIGVLIVTITGIIVACVHKERDYERQRRL